MTTFTLSVVAVPIHFVQQQVLPNIFGYKETLSNLVERETNLNVLLGDNSTHQVKGYGSVSFQLNDGKSIFLQENLYVLGLKKNIVSISALEDK